MWALHDKVRDTIASARSQPVKLVTNVDINSLAVDDSADIEHIGS